MNQLNYKSEASSGGLFSEARVKDSKAHSKVMSFLSGLMSEASGKTLNSKDINSSVNRLMDEIGYGMLEMQCFSNLEISALLQRVEGSEVSFHVRPHFIHTWTSMSLPSPSIQFRADVNTIYKPTFAGISQSQVMTVGYQDIVHGRDSMVLRHSAVLWEYYASQFTNLGYFIKGIKVGGAVFSPSITYNFFSTYKYGEKDFNASPLWQIRFNGVVFLEPQATGVSSTMGTMSRSFSFMYENYDIIMADAGINVND